jgi:hypothetical protein
MMSLRSQMFRSWKIISGNADADFRLYDRSLAGADYICKCLGGANSYEINKFSIAEETTLSDSVSTLPSSFNRSAICVKDANLQNWCSKTFEKQH